MPLKLSVARLDYIPTKRRSSKELNVGDYTQKVVFAENMLAIFEDNDNAIIIMNDEAHFNLNGVVNKHNYRYWALGNSCNLHERPLRSPKATVWSALSKRSIIGRYFIEDNGITVTVNLHRYINMINNIIEPGLRRRRRISRHNLWLQQDRATAHTTRASTEALFPNPVVSRFGDIRRSLRSPDLLICDIFRWRKTTCT